MDTIPIYMQYVYSDQTEGWGAYLLGIINISDNINLSAVIHGGYNNNYNYTHFRRVRKVDKSFTYDIKDIKELIFKLRYLYSIILYEILEDNIEHEEVLSNYKSLVRDNRLACLSEYNIVNPLFYKQYELTDVTFEDYSLKKFIEQHNYGLIYIDDNFYYPF